jgi:hypothetical protein
MNIFLQLTLAGVDTGPFDLFSDTDSYTFAFYTAVPKNSLVAGYYVSAPPGTTTVRIQSVAPSLCTNYTDVVLGLPPVQDCNCYLISSIEDPATPLLGTTFFYTDCNDNLQSIYLNPNQVSYVCSKVLPTYFPVDRGFATLEPNTTNCGGCPPSSSTTTTTTTNPLVSYTLNYCGTVTPSVDRIPYTGLLSPGSIVLGQDNVCYEVVATSPLAPTISVSSTHTTCEDCQSSIPS